MRFHVQTTIFRRQIVNCFFFLKSLAFTFIVFSYRLGLKHASSILVSESKSDDKNEELVTPLNTYSLF